MRWVVDERGCSFSKKSFLTSRGGGPRTRRDAARRDEQLSEVSRVLPASHKSAELDEAGHRETSATHGGPVSELAKGRETEPMLEAPVEYVCRQRRSGRHDRKVGGAPNGSGVSRVRGASTMHQLLAASAVANCQIPHAVESVPKACERSATKPKNHAAASSSVKKMIEATDDRDGVGRSPRSSPRTGKPLTRRRRTVGTASQQEADLCPAR